MLFDFGSALDLLYEVLSGWPDLFAHQRNFRSLFQHTIMEAVIPLIKTLPVDYIEAYKHQTVNSAGGDHSSISCGKDDCPGPGTYFGGKDGSPAGTVTKIIKIARCVLLHFLKVSYVMSILES